METIREPFLHYKHVEGNTTYTIEHGSQYMERRIEGVLFDRYELPTSILSLHSAKQSLEDFK